jgi:Na+/proline symporter
MTAGLLLGVAWWRSRRADNEAFFIGSRNSPWPLVAFGMIGTSLLGVTVVSVLGAVGLTHCSYLQLVMGQALGYGVIAFVLPPLCFRLRLHSICGYLTQRLGRAAACTRGRLASLPRAGWAPC